MIYFTSDLHFYHRNIIRYCNRPFSDSQEMTDKLVENWNKVVKPNDEVYILGDVTMNGPEAAFAALSQLRGRKYLVRGNHDQFVDKKDWTQQYAWVFEWVKDYYELKWQNQLFVLCHYPFVEWHKSHRGSYNLHGHQHNKVVYNYEQKLMGKRRYDVGVDANEYAPVSIVQIIQFFG